MPGADRSFQPLWRPALHALAIAALSGLAACGGGGGSADAGSASGAATSGSSGVATEQPLAAPTQTEASRFLAQATYGPTDAAIADLTTQGYRAWITAQFAKPQTLHRSYMDQTAAGLAANGSSISASQFFESYWAQAVNGDDALRQRVAFALSQVFVVSLADSAVGNQPRGVAAYYDMLGANAFGNYRQLLEAVALHPMMGLYLSHLRNQKEDAASGRVPDENFAREVMQLFSIGLVQLNADGTPKLGADGQPIDTYTHDDIAGLAKVFTGFSWYAGPNSSDRTKSRFFGGDANLDRDWQPMQPYPDFHSVSAKSFLGASIGAQSAPDPAGDLAIALDTLFKHPNVGPFIGRQLIQRLVSSNPSPAYVGRVAAAFNDNGSGVRGDMKAVISAVLLDREARADPAASVNGGKLREPVLRLANLLHSYKATSTNGRYTGIDNTDDPATKLGQSPMRSGSVFNFYRPGYTPPNTSIAAAGLVAPEMQISNEVSAAGYLNYMRGWLTVNAGRDVQPDFTAELALADKSDLLIERVNLLLMGGQMPVALRAQLQLAVDGRALPAAKLDATGAVTNQADIDKAKRDRVSIAVFLAMASPDYLSQR